jgi:hypothetical protein
MAPSPGSGDHPSAEDDGGETRRCRDPRPKQAKVGSIFMQPWDVLPLRSHNHTNKHVVPRLPVNKITTTLPRCIQHMSAATSLTHPASSTIHKRRGSQALTNAAYPSIP